MRERKQVRSDSDADAAVGNQAAEGRVMLTPGETYEVTDHRGEVWTTRVGQFDKAAWQREYMRKQRKAKKDALYD
jgi:hypothetical protein